jgi:hypothetical protein
MMYALTYAVVVSFLLWITGMGNFSISYLEITVFAVVVGATTIGFGIGSTILASIPFFGGGSVYTWDLGLFIVITEIAAYVSSKMLSLFPNGTPFFFQVIFIMPFLAPLLWSMYATFLKSGVEG